MKLRDWILLGFGVAFVLFCAKADAEPLYRVVSEDGSVTITLHSEPCKLDAVKNLTKRATWTEKGKVYEGCYAAHNEFPIVIFYFEDKTITVAPQQVFRRVTGA